VIYHSQERTDRRHLLPTSANPLQHHPTIPILVTRILHSSNVDLRVGAPCGLSAGRCHGDSYLLASRAYLRLHDWAEILEVGMWTAQRRVGCGAMNGVVGAFLMTDDLAI
jgi:hypothetical protein